MPSELSDHHHLFIQAMLLRRVAPVEQWKKIWKKSANLLGLEVDDNEFCAFYGEINDRIEPLGFRIDTTTDEGNGPIGDHQDAGANRRPQQAKPWMALVNTRSDDAAKLGTEFSPLEISLFKKVVDRIIRAPNLRFCVSSHDAVRLAGRLEQSMKKSDCERLLLVLVKKGWLSLSQTGHYSLSVRARLELKTYITDTYNEEDQPPVCAGCREVVMRGYKCPNAECPKAMHVTCAARNARHSDRCPSCKSHFTNDVPIGEDAPTGGRFISDDEGEDYSLSQGPKRHKGRRSTQTQQEEDELSDEQDPASTSNRRRSGRARPSQTQSGRY